MKIVSIDLETHLIGQPDVLPKPVVLSVYDDEGTACLYQCIPVKMKSLLEEPRNVFVGHNVSFDFAVLFHWYPELRPLIWDAYAGDRVRCTAMRERLHLLATLGVVDKSKGAPGVSLAACVQRYFGEDLSATKGEDSWRMRYAELEDVPMAEWPADAVKYALDDTKWTYHLYQAQEKTAPYGTESLQTTADFVLALVGAEGFMVDQDRVQAVKAGLEATYEEAIQVLIANDFASYKKVKGALKLTKSMKKLGALAEELYPDAVKRTDKGAVSLSADGLKGFPSNPVFDALKIVKANEKLLTSFIPALEGAEFVHPVFNTLVETGRSSCRKSSYYPSENIQQIPKKGGIRECHVARPGCCLVSIDYASLELRSLAQATTDFGYDSKMLAVLNDGKDPHSIMGAELMSRRLDRPVSYEEFFLKAKATNYPDWTHDRFLAKMANFGFPGGMGARRFQDTLAKDGIEVTLEEAQGLRNAFLDTYSEMRAFFEDLPKWEKYDGTYEYTTNDRKRAGCSYASAANGLVLQSLSADGVKIATARVTRACYDPRLNSPLLGSRVLAVIHDELIVEIPHDYRVRERVMEAMLLMLSSMAVVMPDVRLEVEAEAMTRWTKDNQDYIFYSTSAVLDPVRGSL